MIIIRSEKPEDFKAIYEINKEVFDSEVEAQLIEKIRRSDNFIPELSLVAEKDSKVVGHILFSRAKIKETIILILAPMTVLPEFQKQGIGSSLIKEGLKIGKDLDYPLVVLVGHPNYYPRFGFIPARAEGLESSLSMPVPDEAFMVYELKENALKKIKGMVEFPLYFEEE